MKLFVGLGNPGNEYAMTRHNIGFMVMDHLINKLQLSGEKEFKKGIIIKFKYKNEDVIILKPQTFMNLSGEAVREVVDFFKIAPIDVIVVHDDLDLPLGNIRLRGKCGSGGHNGIKNIVQNLGTEDFKRIRIGIGKSMYAQGADWVLGKLNLEEQAIVKPALEKAACALLDSLSMNYVDLMTKYNTKDKPISETSDKDKPN